LAVLQHAILQGGLTKFDVRYT